MRVLTTSPIEIMPHSAMLLVQHRHMAEAAVGHHFHQLFHRVAFRAGGHAFGHVGRDSRPSAEGPFGGNGAHQIALGKNAGQRRRRP